MPTWLWIVYVCLSILVVILQKLGNAKLTTALKVVIDAIENVPGNTDIEHGGNISGEKMNAELKKHIEAVGTTLGVEDSIIGPLVDVMTKKE